MNKWFSTIINPQKPNENNSSKDFDLYSTRKASSMFYGVVYPEQVKPKKVIKKAPRKIITVKKKKKMPTEGGC